MESKKDLANAGIAWGTLKSGPQRLIGELTDVAFPGLEGLGQLAEPAVLDITAERSEKDMHVSGFLSARVAMACVRCLNAFAAPLEVEIDRLYAVGVDPSTKSAEREMIDDLIFLKDGFLSAKRMAEEELLLALPLSPICRDSCAGWCSGCGVDLNAEACQCAPEEPDSPFAALKKLKISEK